jgi:hypothetical protein
LRQGIQGAKHLLRTAENKSLGCFKKECLSPSISGLKFKDGYSLYILHHSSPSSFLILGYVLSPPLLI